MEGNDGLMDLLDAEMFDQNDDDIQNNEALDAYDPDCSSPTPTSALAALAVKVEPVPVTSRIASTFFSSLTSLKNLTLGSGTLPQASFNDVSPRTEVDSGMASDLSPAATAEPKKEDAAAATDNRKDSGFSSDESTGEEASESEKLNDDNEIPSTSTPSEVLSASVSALLEKAAALPIAPPGLELAVNVNALIEKGAAAALATITAPPPGFEDASTSRVWKKLAVDTEDAHGQQTEEAAAAAADGTSTPPAEDEAPWQTVTVETKEDKLKKKARENYYKAYLEEQYKRLLLKLAEDPQAYSREQMMTIKETIGTAELVLENYKDADGNVLWELHPAIYIPRAPRDKTWKVQATTWKPDVARKKNQSNWISSRPGGGETHDEYERHSSQWKKFKGWEQQQRDQEGDPEWNLRNEETSGSTSADDQKAYTNRKAKYDYDFDDSDDDDGVPQAIDRGFVASEQAPWDAPSSNHGTGDAHRDQERDYRGERRGSGDEGLSRDDRYREETMVVGSRNGSSRGAKSISSSNGQGFALSPGARWGSPESRETAPWEKEDEECARKERAARDQRETSEARAERDRQERLQWDEKRRRAAEERRRSGEEPIQGRGHHQREERRYDDREYEYRNREQEQRYDDRDQYDHHYRDQERSERRYDDDRDERRVGYGYDRQRRHEIDEKSDRFESRRRSSEDDYKMRDKPSRDYYDERNEREERGRYISEAGLKDKDYNRNERSRSYRDDYDEREKRDRYGNEKERRDWRDEERNGDSREVRQPYKGRDEEDYRSADERSFDGRTPQKNREMRQPRYQRSRSPIESNDEKMRERYENKRSRSPVESENENSRAKRNLFDNRHSREHLPSTSNDRDVSPARPYSAEDLEKLRRLEEEYRILARVKNHVGQPVYPVLAKKYGVEKPPLPTLRTPSASTKWIPGPSKYMAHYYCPEKDTAIAVEDAEVKQWYREGRINARTLFAMEYECEPQHFYRQEDLLNEKTRDSPFNGVFERRRRETDIQMDTFVFNEMVEELKALKKEAEEMKERRRRGF